MSIRLQRMLACDSCSCASIGVLATIDVKEGEAPNWQGWREIPSEMEPDQYGRKMASRHQCPECVAAGVPLSLPVGQWVDES